MKPLFFIALSGLLLGGTAQGGPPMLSSIGSLSAQQGSKSGSVAPGTGTSQTTTAATTTTSQTVQTTNMAQHAQASLLASMQALQAQQASQSAARASALSLPNSVANGLNGPNSVGGIAGLVPDSGLAAPGIANPVTTWVNASTPTQTTSNGQTTVTVVQSAPTALLNWLTFNIGTNTTLNFDQSLGGADAASWVAVNKVAANIAPSQILGSITAPGQVYVINQNGIIFGGASQINVGALVASSLPINDNLSDPTTGRGLLNNPDLQFLFSQSNLSAGSQGPTGAFTPPVSPTGGMVAKLDAAGNVSLVPATGHDGDVAVLAGAQLVSPSNAENVGGKIALVGPNVANAGTISTPDGQTILAAGNEVAFTAHNSNDPTLRGLDVYVGTVDSSSGTAINTGLIESPRADITMVGKSVVQNGVIDSSTSVSANGRIDLLAEYGAQPFINGQNSFSGATGFYPTSTDGTVALGAGSVTQILPELSSTDTVVGTQLALSSIVNIEGHSITLEPNALLWAPSANVPSDITKPALAAGGLTLNSGVTLDAGEWLPFNFGFAFFNTSGTIDLAPGATIDVSGSENVAASAAEDIVAAQLLGTELADSPLQQNGPLYQQTVDVDLLDSGVNADGSVWIGTPVADVSGYVNLVQHTVGELTTSGGTVSLKAGQNVNLESGSTINVSGGWINYQAAPDQTSKVVTANGQILDISQASPDVVYQGVYKGTTITSAKWGNSTTSGNSLISGSVGQAGYIQGGNGGALSITAPTTSVNGNLYGNTVAGSYQRTLASQLSTTYAGASFLPTILATQAVPTASALTLSFQGQNRGVANYPTYSSAPPAIDFGASQAAGDLVLSPDLINKNGFGNFTINNSDGSIFVPADVALTTSTGGSITFQGANVDIEGSLTAPGGNIAIDVYDYSPYAYPISPVTGQTLLNPPPVDPTRGVLTLGATGSLSVAGLIVDDRPTAAAPDSLPLVTKGGTIVIDSFTADLETGSTLNVSGGAALNTSGAVSYGAGGSLSVLAGQDPIAPDLPGGHLVLDSTLIGYSGTKGGSLTVQAPLVQIGGVAADPADTLLLTPDFFNQGGFASFTIEGLGEVAPNQSNPNLFLPAVSIAAGTQIDPVVQNWALSTNSSGLALTPITYPLLSERTPVRLAFNAEGINGFGGGFAARGDFVMGTGAVINAGPNGNVSIAGSTVDVLGSVIAPGGSITISGAKSTKGLFPDSDPQNPPLVTVDIGPDALLSTAGIVELTQNQYDYTTGSVLGGGSVTISGDILAETGSVIDVSGTTGVLDVLPSQVGQISNPLFSQMVPTRIDSAGGSITLAGGLELVSDATLRGAAGGPSAQGGSLSVSSGRYDPSEGLVATTPLDVTLEVTQGPLVYSASGIGNTVLVNGSTAGFGYFAADSFNGSGLDSLTLGGTVQFSGPVTIDANRSLTVGGSGVIYAHDAVNLVAPYVDLGQAFQGPLTQAQQQLPIFTDSNSNGVEIAPAYGAGTITVTADSLIDVGNLSLQGIGQLNLNTLGDVRGDGTLDIAGDISIAAGQVYPTTDITFTMAAYDHGGTAGSVQVTGNGTRQLPLSAGGILNIYASDITQGGVLRAPIGTINLGSGITGSSPIDPLSGQAFASTQNLTLTTGSETSVSAVDPLTGEDLTIPYGTLLNGVSWIDPAGDDITVAGNGAYGVPGKAINLSGVNVVDQAGATIDISGGGDLYAYRFVSGTGGTNDILTATNSYAVIPGYSAAYAPYYSSTDYTNSGLKIGTQVYLGAGSGLPAGIYTLLPARYALLPGAFLITSVAGAPPATPGVQPDGSSLVAGYIYNGLNKAQTAAPLLTSFEVAPQAVVNSRAEYDGYSANSFLSQSAAAQGTSVRLPIDAGQLVLAATRTMTIQGTVASQTPTGGLGSQVDIASPSDILISGPNTDLSGVGPGTLVLDSSDLSAFGADSLLIGGYRTSTTAGTTVTVTTNDLTVDNVGASLSGPDVILASNQTLTLAPGADVQQSGTLTSLAETLLFGNSSVAGSGDGVVVRVGSDASAQIIRSGVDNAAGPFLVIGAGAEIAGNSLILDSTAATSLDPTANISGSSIALDSGQISLVLDGSQPTSGLVLSSAALNSLQASASTLSLLSYSSIDIYENGTGAIGDAADASGHYQVQGLALHADEIRGFDGGTVSINAEKVMLDDSAGGTAPSLGGVPANGKLVINASTIQLGGGSGANALVVDGYQDVNLNASGGILAEATKSSQVDSSNNPIQGSASLTSAGNLEITAPLITGATGANLSVIANGALMINPVAGGSTATVAGGLGATLNLQGQSVIENSLVQLPSGNLNVIATGGQGNITIGGKLDVSGTATPFNDLIEYTSGGQVNLTADSGSVILNQGGQITVAANAGGGNAGQLTVSAASGTFTNNGSLSGQAGAGGQGGVFSADVQSIPGGSVEPLDSALGAGGFTQSISIRDRTDANVSVDGTVRTAAYNLSADQGSITVNGTIDASNVAATDSLGNAIQVGGSINLVASGSVTLASGSKLDVSGQNFSNAGKGGSVTLIGGSEINGVQPSGADRQGDGTFAAGEAAVSVASGSTIDLRVAANDNSDGSINATQVAANAANGNFSGKLQIQAPRTTDNTDVQVDPINGTVLGASSVVVVGNKVYTPAGGSITATVEGNPTTSAANDGSIAGDANGFLSVAGAVASSAYTQMVAALFGHLDTTTQAVSNVEAGAVIVNTSGDLTLPSNWDLSTFRFGPNSAAGVLTMRASGNLIFKGALSDGFLGAANTATLLPQNTAVPVNDQSWSYNLTAGADFTAADVQQVLPKMETYDPATGLAAGTATGSLELGNFVTKNDGNAIATGGINAKTGTALAGFYQVIRTGTGDIDIATAGDVLLQNQFASIYTAGTPAAPLANFDTPVLQIAGKNNYGAQYTLAGGNVTIAAKGNIAHVTKDSSGNIVEDSEKELPNNWLYRRGYVDPATGQFGATANVEPSTGNPEIGSTSWWTDFSNYFEGIGTLGGGNVSLTAGHDVSNVDAVAPTNARMTKQTSTGDLLAADQTLVELGGGNVLVQAGNDINGGAYYVERGQGTLEAGNSIVTNFTRSASVGTISLPATINDSQTWLPTTLFLGKGSFDVSAQNDLLLGPVANVFLLPQGVGNTYWDKTYFSTYAPTDAINITSLTGSVTLREGATLADGGTATPLLQNWFQYVDLLGSAPPSVSFYQPWLNITETDVTPFAVVDTILPSTLRVEALSGDIDTIGNLTLSPSPTGTIDFIAEGSINALQPNGVSGAVNPSLGNLTTWSSSTINLSDADPAAIPGVTSPYAYEVVVGTNPAASQTTGGAIDDGNGNIMPVQLDLSFIDDLFAESGSTEGVQGVLQTKLKLHASINGQPLHAGDTNPVHIYAKDNISGLTLFSGKAARVVAGRDITDIGFYVQNDAATDITLVAAGRDIIAYDANSPLRVSALSGGNALDLGSGPASGDIQIGGPGTLEVLAGRDLDLGVGPSNPDGTGVGISSIGQNRNPVLPFAGADIVALAGVGGSTLDQTALNFTNADQKGFTDLFLNPITGGTYAAQYLPDLGALMQLPSSDSNAQIWSAFRQLSVPQQDLLALDVYYLVLRDAGREHNATGDDYTAGFAAVGALFPGKQWQGDITLTSREIKTVNGGNISLLAPGGEVDVGLNVAGAQPVDQGILTDDGGNISIFTDGDVNVGTSRIFTLNGGNIVIWSTHGDIDAGASSKTVQAAPPTRVIIDPQSGAVETDLAGLATGGGIGTLESNRQKVPSSVDLIAPNGTVDAGDAGIRSSGDLNIAAVQVLNAGNIQAGGKSTGIPTLSAPNIGGLAAASSVAGATSNAANQAARQAGNQAGQQNTQEVPSLITVEVLGYGGDSTDETQNDDVGHVNFVLSK